MELFSHMCFGNKKESAMANLSVSHCVLNCFQLSGLNLGVIIGGACGGLLVVCLVAGMVICCCRFAL